MFLIMGVISLIELTVRPNQVSLAVHFIVKPVSRVYTPITPGVNAMPRDVIRFEASFILVPVIPLESTLAILHPLVVLSIELRAIRPAFQTLAVLAVLAPVSLVARAILVEQEAEPVRLTIHPLSLVDITVTVDQTPKERTLILVPIAFIKAAVGPYLGTSALSDVSVDAPLTDISRPIVKGNHWSLFTSATV